jgi:hypothetical protein
MRAIAAHGSTSRPVPTDAVRGFVVPGLAVPVLVLVVAAGLVAVHAESAAAQQPYLAGQTSEWVIAAAPLAAPAPLREGAEVRAWTEDGQLVVLRPGTNGLVCLGPRPGAEGFMVACYHDSLEPFMARGRALLREGVEGRERDEIRWREIDEGSLAMPAAAMVYNLGLPSADFDPATVDPATGRRLHALYLRGARAEELGVPARPTEGLPWLMFDGTPSAHLMISIPPRAPEPARTADSPRP